jgi:peptidoglycan/xylan/chitin deacetylase (PgdA/CDA1 family)
MDDVGASSKRYEIYSNWRARLGPLYVSGNWLFLKYLSPFKAWGPYQELGETHWNGICRLLEEHRAKLTVAITAGWVESEHEVVPFPERFPRQAAAIREGVRAGLLEVANHGLTHCVLDNNLFKPRWFSGNRLYHREFWEWVPVAVHARHVERSQRILQDYFAGGVVTFVPPGNVFTDDTLELAARNGLRFLSAAAAPGHRRGMAILGNDDTEVFHDRDVALHGVAWLQRCLERHAGAEFCFVRDLGARFGTGEAARTGCL